MTADIIIALLISFDVVLLVRTVRGPARAWLRFIRWSKRFLRKTRCEVVSEKKTDDEQCGSGRTLDANAFVERESLRSLLSRPFFWLAYLAVVVLL